jgi:hypothetical protein
MVLFAIKTTDLRYGQVSSLDVLVVYVRKNMPEIIMLIIAL